MSADAPKPASTADLLLTLIDEIRGLRDDMRRRSGLPDVKIGKATMRDWAGPSYEGKAASDCPADFLLEYAGFLEWKAGKNRADGKEHYAATNEREALMCRRWAAINKHVRSAASGRSSETVQDGQAPDDTTKPKWGGNNWAKRGDGT